MNASEPLPIPARSGALEVYLLGLVDFDAAQFLQERLMRDVSGYDDGRGAVLVCEHPPLITVGREGSRSEIRCSQDELTARQIEVRWINRGGGCLVHAPGQLAVYPILPIAERGWGLAAYRERLEQSLLAMCRDMRIAAEPAPCRPGVVCRSGQVAHVGVAIRSWISSHGMFVNVNPRMDALALVRSGGMRASSLAAQRGAPVAMPAVRESLVRNLAARLEYSRFHLYTGHPLLRRTKRVVAYA
jgi:lipoyl(octanoyl) transferase